MLNCSESGQRKVLYLQGRRMVELVKILWYNSKQLIKA
jgi:hypothetical protein